MYQQCQRSFCVFDFTGLKKQNYFDFYLKNDLFITQQACLQIKSVGEDFTLVNFDFEKPNA